MNPMDSVLSHLLNLMESSETYPHAVASGNDVKLSKLSVIERVVTQSPQWNSDVPPDVDSIRKPIHTELKVTTDGVNQSTKYNK